MGRPAKRCAARIHRSDMSPRCSRLSSSEFDLGSYAPRRSSRLNRTSSTRALTLCAVRTALISCSANARRVTERRAQGFVPEDRLDPIRKRMHVVPRCAPPRPGRGRPAVGTVDRDNGLPEASEAASVVLRDVDRSFRQTPDITRRERVRELLRHERPEKESRCSSWRACAASSHLPPAGQAPRSSQQRQPHR